MLGGIVVIGLLCGSALGASINGTTSKWNDAPVVNFFVKLINGEAIGAQHCKTDMCCGDGLKCDLLLRLCVPLDTPVFRDTEKACATDGDCSALHECRMGSCRFCGIRSCHSNLDCCEEGVQTATNLTRECVDLKHVEQWVLAKELGRITATSEARLKPHKLKKEEDIDSDELQVMGQSAWGDHVLHGRHCWQKCNTDVDCILERIPENLWKKQWGCCNGYCTRRLSCVSLPENFQSSTGAPKLVKNNKLDQSKKLFV